MDISLAKPDEEGELTLLIARFRVSLSKLRGVARPLDLDSARKELREYQNKAYPIYVARDKDAGLVGYLVCRVEDSVVWAESLYVLPQHRRQGIGSRLYEKVERLAAFLGGESPYNWVDPNNDRIIQFLKKRKYRVLNLIELRRPRAGEDDLGQMRVGQHVFLHGGRSDGT
jgi:ribosomal protein S18 acetylase RimI-like enzyme